MNAVVLRLQQALAWACSSMTSTCLARIRHWVWSPAPYKPCIVAKTHNLSISGDRSKEDQNFEVKTKKKKGVPTYPNPVVASEERERACSVSFM